MCHEQTRLAGRNSRSSGQASEAGTCKRSKNPLNFLDGAPRVRKEFQITFASSSSDRYSSPY